MTTRVYRNTDSGAPTLDGLTPGGIINLLDKCLVSGYGSKAPAGWSKPFVGTNLAAFRMGAGSMCYLRVDDTYSSTTLHNARVRGYETMSDVNTGTGEFPRLDQQAGSGLYWYSQGPTATGNSTARNWCVIADERFFYVFWSTQPTADTAGSTSYSEAYFFGDAEPYNPTDTWFTVIGGSSSNVDYVTSAAGGLWTAYTFAGFSSGASNLRLYTRRRFDGIPGAQNAHALTTDMGKMGGTSSTDLGNGAAAYPAIDGSLLCARVEVIDRAYATSIRGRLPGLWSPLHPPASVPLTRWDTFSGSGDLAGRTFIVWRQGTASAYFETSNTWRT